MKLIWHIAKKDLTRMRLPLAVWVLIMLAKITIGVGLRRSDAAFFAGLDRIQIYVNICTGLEALMLYVFVALLIHEDQLMGTQASWRTRPISGARLMGGKFLGAVLMFGLLPVLVNLPWWVLCEFGPREIWSAAISTLGWQALVVLPALSVAVLTNSFSRYFTLSLGLAAIVAVGGTMKIAYVPDPLRMSTGVLQSRLWLSLGLAVTGIVAVILHQFLTRRIVRSWALGLSLLGLTVLCAGAWEWDVSGLCELREKDPVSPAGLTLIARRAVGSEIAVADFPEPSKREWAINVVLHARGVPEDLILVGAESRLSWRSSAGDWRTAYGWIGGSRLSHAYGPVRHSLDLGPEQTDPETLQWITAQRIARTGKGFPPPRRETFIPLRAYIYLHDPALDRLPADPVDGKLTTQFALMRPIPCLELPLKVDARQTNLGYSVRISNVAPATWKDNIYGLRVSLVATRPLTRADFDRILADTSHSLVIGWLWRLLSPADAEGVEFYAVNRPFGRMESVGHTDGEYVSSLRINEVQISLRTLVVRKPTVVRDGHWVAWRKDWTDVLTLNLIRFKKVGSFEQTVPTEKFEPLQPDAGDRVWLPGPDTTPEQLPN